MYIYIYLFFCVYCCLISLFERGLPSGVCRSLGALLKDARLGSLDYVSVCLSVCLCVYSRVSESPATRPGDPLLADKRGRRRRIVFPRNKLVRLCGPRQYK